MEFGVRRGSWNQSPTDTEGRLSFPGVKSYIRIFDWAGVGATNPHVVLGSTVLLKILKKIIQTVLKILWLLEMLLNNKTLPRKDFYLIYLCTASSLKGHGGQVYGIQLPLSFTNDLTLGSDLNSLINKLEMIIVRTTQDFNDK